MATASSWMPAAGRHNVSIGSSLSKALKARKGQPPTQRSKALPERDFYALRYNHKPASIDPTKPGTLEVNPGREVTTVRVERPTVNNKEVIVFKGEEKPAKEWECVLIYDEATQTFTLEKLDSLVNLNFDAKAPPRTRPTASPPSQSSSSAAQTPQRSQPRTAADELEAQLEGSSTGLGTGIDANGKTDPGSFSLARGEEGEGEEVVINGGAGAVVAASPTPKPRHGRSSLAHQKAPIPPQPQPSQPQAQQTKVRPTPSKKSAPMPTATTPQSAKAARVSATPAAATVPAATPAASSSKRSRPVASTTSTAPASAKRGAPEYRDVDVEDFEIRGPIAPVTTSGTASASATRRSSTATTTPIQSSQGSLSFSLALPTASSGPDPLAHLGLYNSNNGAAAGGVSTSASVSGAMESDDEWDEILAQPDRSVSSFSSAHHSQQRPQQQEPLTIMMEDDADADVDDGLDFLERELLGEDEPMGDGDGDEEEEDLEEEI
ncbi:RNA polymerase II transcription elongation factor-domain-containing protein [Russula ochroleuca]|uniref:RNA polymerase II transcription elongation factor-domain-containing protein n=1 Tax=Russula ochroleuca TaxID=152965 RepID=A0A9P5N3K5_9AGAM|nr:RNA polymerase II transcription elongation factor-domain-containing protein [Russula ochroleuca]